MAKLSAEVRFSLYSEPQAGRGGDAAQRADLRTEHPAVRDDDPGRARPARAPGHDRQRRAHGAAAPPRAAADRRAWRQDRRPAAGDHRRPGLRAVRRSKSPGAKRSRFIPTASTSRSTPAASSTRSTGCAITFARRPGRWPSWAKRSSRMSAASWARLRRTTTCAWCASAAQSDIAHEL